VADLVQGRPTSATPTAPAASTVFNLNADLDHRGSR
jgi:hypothetical protein